MDEKMLLNKKERDLLIKCVNELILDSEIMNGNSLNIKELSKLKEKINYFHK